MRRLTLSQRLALVAGVALLPTVAILVLNFVSLRAQTDQRLHEGARQTAHIALLELKRIIGGVETMLRAVGSAEVVTSGQTDRCNAYLAQVTRVTPEVSDMAVADADGRVVCASSVAYAPISIADRDYFNAVRATGVAVTGSYAIGRLSGRATFPVAMPLPPDSAWPGGVIAAGLDLAWLGQRLKERDFLGGNALTVADRHGRILAREPFPERFVGTVIPESFRHLVTAEKAGTMAVVSQDGTQRVIGYLPVSPETHGLYVSAGVASDPVHAATNRLILQGGVLALAGIAATLLIAHFTSNYFIRRPFRRLITTIEAWQHDDLQGRTRLGNELAEFGRAGRALDTFMDQLTAARAARREAEREREVMARELDHRIKNLVATVQAVARRTFRGKGHDEAVRTFSDRLQAMASAHQVLMVESWQSAPVAAIVEETIAPFEDAQRQNFRVDGPNLVLLARAAMALSMALHELCTNAAKYGGLSVGTGQVAISWGVDMSGGGPTFVLTWSESGGPPVRPPTAAGFGTAMIEQMLGQQSGGSAQIVYRTEGLFFRFAAPCERVVADALGEPTAAKPELRQGAATIG